MNTLNANLNQQMALLTSYT